MDGENAAPAGRRGTSAKRERVRRHLLDLIDGAGPGTALPPERDLSQELGVSRPTVRAVIEELAGSGLLVRQHGRGTFTSPHKITQELTGTGTNAFAVPPAEGNWASRVLEFGVAAAGARIGGKLRLSPAEPVLRVTRLRVVDGGPIGIERIRVPAAIVPGIEAVDLESGNFYQLLRTRYQVVVADAVQTLEPTVADAEEARLLDVPEFAPSLLVERTARDATERVVEFTRSIYRGDRYRVTSTLRFDSSSG